MQYLADRVVEEGVAFTNILLGKIAPAVGEKRKDEPTVQERGNGKRQAMPPKEYSPSHGNSQPS